MGLYFDPEKFSLNEGATYWFATTIPTSNSNGKKTAVSKKSNMVVPEGYAHGAYGFKHRDGKYWGLLLANFNHKKFAGQSGYKASLGRPGKSGADKRIWAGAPFYIPTKKEMEHFIKTGETTLPEETPLTDEEQTQEEEATQEEQEQQTTGNEQEEQQEDPPPDEPDTSNQQEEETKSFPPDNDIKAMAEARYKDDPQGMQTNRVITEYDLFPEDYFSGCDVSVYIGDTWVEDVTGVEFQLIENVLPIYGYNSFTYDQIARGSRLVQGRFTIAFKKSGYLWTILDHVGQLKNKAQPHFAYLFNEDSGGKVPKYVNQAQMKIDELLNYYGQAADKPYQGRIREYEQEAWGRTFTDDVAHRDRTFFYNQRRDGATRYLLQSGFDLHMVYGPLEAIRVNNGGQMPEETDVNTTVKVIRGVQLTNTSQVLDWSGEPILEVYEFIAQDLD